MRYGLGMGFHQGFQMFNVFGILFAIGFVFVIGVFIVIFVKGISQWGKNNKSPRLTVPATLIAKRTDVSRRHHGGVGDHHHHHHTSTSYYATFQVESGDRMEFLVSGQEYGLLMEGDRGNLSFQGTRYLGFARQSL